MSYSRSYEPEVVQMHYLSRLPEHVADHAVRSTLGVCLFKFNTVKNTHVEVSL